MGTVVDISDYGPFVEKDWIGLGKKYDDVPAFVRWKRDEEMEIPLEFTKIINFPDSKISVNEFLAIDFPRVSSEIITSMPSRWLSKNLPDAPHPIASISHSALVTHTLSSLPPLNLADVPTHTLGQGTLYHEDLDFDMLIDMRRRHQTKQAEKGVRTKKSKAASSTMRGRIIHDMHEALKILQDDVAIGTGADRSKRWQDNRVPAPGGRDAIINGLAAPEASAGGTANAALAAKEVSKKAAATRIRLFTLACVPNLAEVSAARITTFRPLQVDDYGVVVTPNGVMIGKVTALFSKTGGKNGKHSLVSESSNISAISYLSVQLYEHMYAHQFRAVTSATATFQTNEFMLLPSLNFLTLIDYKGPPQQQLGVGLELAQLDLVRFRTLQQANAQLQKALVLSRRKRGGLAPISDDED